LKRARRGQLPASVLTRFLPYWSGPPPTKPQESEPAEGKNQSRAALIDAMTSEEQLQLYDIYEKAQRRLDEQADETPPRASR